MLSVTVRLGREDVAMAVTQGKPAPYAPASAILALIERHRNKGLPVPVNADVLGRASISKSLIPRTLQAMQTLDLIDEDGKPTPILEGLRLAPETEFLHRMTEWLNAAYSDALTFVDPATDDEGRIRDAFRSYNPVGQQSRMVALFTGLFKAAGGAPVQRSTSRKATAGAGKPTAVPSTKAVQDVPRAREQETATERRPDPAEMTATPEQPLAIAPEQTLLNMLDPVLMEKPEQDAVWTLILYLKARESRSAKRNEASSAS